MLGTVLKNTFNFERIINQNIHIHDIYIFVTARQAKRHYLDFLQVKDEKVDYNSMKK